MSTLSRLSDRTHYLIVGAVEAYDENNGIETLKFQVCALPYNNNGDEIIWDGNEDTGEQNYADDFKQAQEMSNYFNCGMRTRRYMEDYLGLVTNSRDDLDNTGAVERIVDNFEIKYRVNKAVLANNVKQEMMRNGYDADDFQLAMAVRVMREHSSEILDLI